MLAPQALGSLRSRRSRDVVIVEQTLPAVERRPDETLALRVNGEPRVIRRQSPWPREHEHCTSWPSLGWSGVRYRVEAVYQRTVAELRARGSAFWSVFTPLARDATGAALREVVVELRDRFADRDALADYYAVMLVLADIDPWGYHLKKEIEAMIEQEAVDWLNVSETLRTTFEKGEKLGIEKGEKLGIEKGEKLGIEKGEKRGIVKGIEEVLRRLFARRLGRELTPSEAQALTAHASAGRAEQAEDRAFSLEGEALAQWLLDPKAT